MEARSKGFKQPEQFARILTYILLSDPFSNCFNLSPWIQGRHEQGKLITPESVSLKRNLNLLELFTPHWKSPKLGTTGSHRKCQKGAERILGFNTNIAVSITSPSSTHRIATLPHVILPLMFLFLYFVILYILNLDFKTFFSIKITLVFFKVPQELLGIKSQF